jgi:dihydrodipicolinate synthase/N-acetylneuraminate lyase
MRTIRWSLVPALLLACPLLMYLQPASGQAPPQSPPPGANAAAEKPIRDLVDAFARGIEETGLPAQVGCYASHTLGVIERAKYAREKGITRVQIALPSWITLNDWEVRRFYERIHTELPDLRLIHYNLARSGRMLTGKDYLAVREVAPTLAGSKHTGGDVSALIDVVRATPEMDHFVVDGQIVAGALYGAKGFYSFVANLSPAFALRLWRLCEAKEWEEAARLHERCTAFFAEWLATCPEINSSSALGKIATRAGILDAMPLAIREPYRSGTDHHVHILRNLVSERFPDLAS